jgi:predicted thioesterase
LIQIEGRKLTFAFTVSDSVEEVASGMHERFIIDIEKFMKKTAMRK